MTREVGAETAEQPLTADEAASLYDALATKARRRRSRRLVGRWIGATTSVAFLGVTLLVSLGALTGLIGGDRSNPASDANTCVSSGTEISLVTRDDGLGFESSCFEVSHGAEFTITFTSKVPGSNAIAIFTEPPSCEVAKTTSDGVRSFTCEPTAIFLGDPVNGPGTIVYRVQALEPGTYYFHSSNPQMFEFLTGELVVR